MKLYVHPDGSDDSRGRLPRPDAGADGPLASLAGVRDRLRSLRRIDDLRPERTCPDGAGEPVTVEFAPGEYPVRETVVFGPGDTAPVHFTCGGGGPATLCGGERIEGLAETRVHNRRCWVAELPEVAAGRWNFRSLFVNGRRAVRSRMPAEGLFVMEDVPGVKLPFAGTIFSGSHDSFIAEAGSFEPWQNLEDVEVVALHWWIEERFGVKAFDAATRRVVLDRKSRFPLVDDVRDRFARYYVENVFEALARPGQWYLDRRAGRLYYMPRRGETLENSAVYAPRVRELIRIAGGVTQGRPVEFLRFSGLRLCCTDWRYPGEREDGTREAYTVDPLTGRISSRGDFATVPQAASDVPGSIVLRGARHCRFEDCLLENLGGYGIEIDAGCEDIHVVGCEIRDTAAGGVRINGGTVAAPPAAATRMCRVSDNHLHDGGKVFTSACGILSMHASQLEIRHNRIHDYGYTGISVGWVWGYKPSATHRVLIEGNHVHDLGGRGLSDMGGIYLLGVQPGTVVRGNLVHDIEKANYGGWALYPDEGSSHIVFEDNVCYNTNDAIFHQHYGRENVVRNNIFAFAGEQLIAYTRPEPHVGFTLEGNILLSRGEPIYHFGDYDRIAGPPAHRVISARNVIFQLGGKNPTLHRRCRGPKLSLAAWQKLSMDLNSICADPALRNAAKGDFRLKRTSPALRLGFRPIDLSDVGPRPKARRD